MHASLEDVCRQTALELERLEKSKSTPPPSPRRKHLYLDKTFAVKLTRIREKRAANIIIRWWRSVMQRRKPTINLMLRAMQNNKTIQKEIKSLRVELELARKRKEVENQAAALRETFSSVVSPYRSCRLLVTDPLSSPPAIEQLLNLLGTDASSIRATVLNSTRTEIAFALCLSRCSPDDWSKILFDLPPMIIRDVSFPETLSKEGWVSEFEDANAIPPVWPAQTTKASDDGSPIWKAPDPPVLPKKEAVDHVDRLSPLSPAVEPLIDENDEGSVSPTAKTFVEKLKDRVRQSHVVDQETMDAFAALGNRRRRRSGDDPSD